jgi:hypothetical protein
LGSETKLDTWESDSTDYSKIALKNQQEANVSTASQNLTWSQQLSSDVAGVEENTTTKKQNISELGGNQTETSTSSISKEALLELSCMCT